MTEAYPVTEDTPYYTNVDCVRQQTNAIAVDDLTNDQINIFINQAQSIIDSRLANFFDVPFKRDNVPSIIGTIACQMASSLILRKLYTGEADNTSEHEEPLWQQANDLIQRIKNGEMALVDKNGNQIYPSRISYSEVDEYEDVMPDFGEEYPDRVI